MKTIYFLCMVAGLLFFSGCVEPQKLVVLENRVAAIEMENNRQRSQTDEASSLAAAQNQQDQLTLRKDFEKIEKRLNNSRTLSPEEYAELKYDIQIIKEDLQRLEGFIEEINHKFDSYSQNDRETIEKSLQRLDHAISNNYERVIKLEKYMGFEPSAAGPSENTPLTPEELKKGADQQLYDFAKKLFDDGDRENARIQFENFINKYPDSTNADNARFWIADSYYSEKWFEKAILEYQKVLEVYPDSNKLAAARLKQGYAFAELGEKANARLILKEVLKKHPDSNEAKYAREKLKSLN